MARVVDDSDLMLRGSAHCIQTEVACLLWQSAAVRAVNSPLQRLHTKHFAIFKLADTAANYTMRA